VRAMGAEVHVVIGSEAKVTHRQYPDAFESAIIEASAGGRYAPPSELMAV
jgi:hypothetical protein